MEIMMLQLAYDPDASQTEMINDLNDKLAKMGVTITVSHRKKNSYLKIKYDACTYEKALTRNAGKKRKNISPTKIQDIDERTQSAAQVAADLGISRATLYRKLRDAREHGDDYIL